MRQYLFLIVFITILTYAKTQSSIGYSFSFQNNRNNIKNCIQTCRKLLFRGDRDLNYCIEGCRIKTYKRIYDCVYEQCNDKGNGIPLKFSREQYHQCVYLCKVRPKFKPTNTPLTINDKKEKLHFIPVEYHFTNSNKNVKEDVITDNSLTA